MASRQAPSKQALGPKQIYDEIDKAIKQADSLPPASILQTTDAQFQDDICNLCDEAPLRLLEDTRQAILKSSNAIIRAYDGFETLLKDAEVTPVVGEKWESDNAKLEAALDNGHDFIISNLYADLYGAQPPPGSHGRAAKGDVALKKGEMDAATKQAAVADAIRFLEMETVIEDCRDGSFDTKQMLDDVSRGAARMMRKVGYDEDLAQRYLDLKNSVEQDGDQGKGEVIGDH